MHTYVVKHMVRLQRERRMAVCKFMLTEVFKRIGEATLKPWLIQTEQLGEPQYSLTNSNETWVGQFIRLFYFISVYFTEVIALELASSMQTNKKENNNSKTANTI